jgi:catechol 2,3-dioxygenase-like lactoylglutathione lyase family enzyme
MQFNIDRIDHVVINCRDVDETAAWYQRVLGMEREVFGEDRRTALKFGGQKINLRPISADPSVWVTAPNASPGTADLCFISPLSWDEIAGHLHDCGAMIELGPVPRAGALGPMTSLYTRDPDGNLIEIATYLQR